MPQPIAAPTATPAVRLSRLWPFIATFVLAFLLAFLTHDSWLSPDLLIAAAVIITATTIAILTAPFERWPEWTTLVPVAALCVAVDLMRAAGGGGGAAGFGSLLLIPVVWQAMYRRQLELNLTLVLVTLANIAAIVFLTSPVQLAAQWRSVILFSVVAVTIGQTIQRLVVERVHLLDEITALALRDQLTGLSNRRVWDQRLPEAAANAARTGSPLAVALIDLDEFKAFNDQFGHQAGDELLASAGVAWKACLRSADLLVRWGGEEFALLLPNTDWDTAATVLERLQDAVPGGQTFSAGYAVTRVHPDIAVDLDHLMRAADDAMYAAKAAGRARCVAARRPVAGSDSQPVDRSVSTPT